VLEGLAHDAQSFGVRLFLWDHELQLPPDFATAYPQVRGQGAQICLSSPEVWRILEDKYEEFFHQTPSLAGIVLVLSETQIKVLAGSPCRCKACRAATGSDLARRIIQTALAACRKHHKELIVRNFGHGWEEIDTILAAVRVIQPPDAFLVMSKMVPWDFFGLEYPPDPTFDQLPDRPCLLEDTFGEGFRGKTHVVVLPAAYYAGHLQRAAAHGGRGAVFRLDHSAYPRSIFASPSEFNVWLTSRLLWSPAQSLDDLWREWATRRYGEAAAPQVVEALRRSADIWEHSVNTRGFYCTSAHGHLAPFFHGLYNAYGSLVGTAPLRIRSSPELEKTLAKLLHPDRQTLDEVVAEREQAVQWAGESLVALEKAKPHLSEEDYAELSHYLRLLREGSRLWREMGNLFFTGLAILRAEGLPADLMERLRGASERALRQGRRIEQEFGPGAWPVAPDADGRGTRLEEVVAGLWAEVLDKALGLEPLPLPTSATIWDQRLPRTDAEKLYLALLRTAADSQPRELTLGGSRSLARLEFEAGALVVGSAKGQRLALPLAVRVEGDLWDGAAAHRVRIARRAGTLIVRAIPGRPWTAWLSRKLLPETEAATMMPRFVASQLAPLPLPKTREEWLDRRDALRREILIVLGIDDLVPPKWDLALKSKGTMRRDGYRIEKITFESYPGMAISAVVYVPDGISGQVPGIISISGHTNTSKAADYVQQRNVNLALRGCVVLCYDYGGYGERKTGDHLYNPTGANSHDIRTFSFSRRSPTALEVLDAIRALDVLTARPEVDPERIGFTGESGGSNSTYWVSALDPRVKLAVPVCSVTSYDYWIRTDVNWDWHQRPPGIRRIADIGTLLALHAPNPLVVISSKRGSDDQEFPLDEAEKSFQWAKHVYRLLGTEDVAAHRESTTAHGYQEDKREVLYRAVERYLRPPRPQAGKELPAKIETLEDMRCGLPEKNLTFHDVFMGWLQHLPRTTVADDPAKQRAFVRERLGWPDRLPEVKAEKVGQEEEGLWFAEFWIIETEPGIRLPAIWIGKKGTPGPITLVPGRDSRAIERALQAGRQVLAFDLRGSGEIAGGQGSVINWAWFAGRPWPGMWAMDLVQAGRFCRGRLSAPSVSLEAENAYGWSALLAGAAARDLIESGSVYVPWESLHEDVRARGDQALVDVPGLLERLDIPQLRKLWTGGQVSVKR